MAFAVLLLAPEGAERERLDRAFSSAGWNTHYAADDVCAALILTRLRIDLVVLLTEQASSLPLVAALRKNTQVPILVLGAALDDAVVRDFFEAGADDCTSMPTTDALVVVRADTLARRAAPVSDGRPHRFAGIVLDTRSRVVTVRGRPVKLTRTEFELLALLIRNPHRVISRSEMLSQVWGEWYGDDHTVEVHLSRLRRKILDAGGPRVAQSLPGVGYRISDAATTA